MSTWGTVALGAALALVAVSSASAATDKVLVCRPEWSGSPLHKFVKSCAAGEDPLACACPEGFTEVIPKVSYPREASAS
jgi:hypothetical protein